MLMSAVKQFLALSFKAQSQIVGKVRAAKTLDVS